MSENEMVEQWRANCAYCEAKATRMATSCYLNHEPPPEYEDAPPLPVGVVSIAALAVCDDHFEQASNSLCDSYGMASNFRNMPVPLIVGGGA